MSEKNITRVLITMEGGLIQSIISNNEELKVIVIDMDSEGVPYEDILSQETIDVIAKNSSNMEEIKFNSYVSDKPIFKE